MRSAGVVMRADSPVMRIRIPVVRAGARLMQGVPVVMLPEAQAMRIGNPAMRESGPVAETSGVVMREPVALNAMTAVLMPAPGWVSRAPPEVRRNILALCQKRSGVMPTEAHPSWEATHALRRASRSMGHPGDCEQD